MQLTSLSLALTRAGFLTFSPSSLFAAGEQGAWYDPSDLSTLFTDAAGTTPVTAVEQPVGLMLDKSKGLVLGGELVTNGGFSSNTWWTVAGGAAISGGALVFTNALATSGAYRLGFATVGKYYELTFEIVSISSGGVQIGLGDSKGTNHTAPGVYTQRLLCTGNTNLTLYSVGASTTASVDNVSIKELPGNHAFQSTAASRPVLSARVNLLTKTEALTDAAWTKQSGTTVSPTPVAAPDGTLTAFSVTGNGSSGIFQGALGSLSIGQSVRSVWLRTVSGAATVGIKDPAQTQGTTTCNVTTTWQRFTLTETTSPTGGYIGGIWVFNIPTTGIEIAWPDFRSTNTGTNLPVYQRVNTATDYDTAGFPLYLRCDGVDDGMQTNSINFTGTDKMTVVAGVRKIGNSGMISEMSASADANNGAFYLYVGEVASGDVAIGLRGTTMTKLIGAAVTPPVTQVLTAGFDIAGATRATEIFPRINGSAASLSGFGSADAGTGNFGNYPLFLFRRGGTSLPAQLHFFGLIVRGAASTPQQIAQAEAWMNQRTRAY